MRVLVEDASVRFGKNVVFNHFSCAFEPDTVTALVGPSGSGKSTLLSCIAGYERLQHGRIVLDHAEKNAPSQTQIVWIPQGNNALGSRTALDNVMIGALSAGHSIKIARERSLEALADVKMYDKANQTGRKLSGGELQRVNFARAIASGKPLILADEPSSSLDEENTLNVASLLADLANRATIIVATHDPVLMNAAQRVINLRSDHHAA